MESSIEKNAKQPEKLKLKEKIAYGTGDVGNGFLFDLGQNYLLKFYTDACGIPAVLAGSVFLLSKIWDAFADITVGTVIDNRKHIGPKGKFRPFILYTTIPLALVCLLTFVCPGFTVTGKLIWAYATYMLFGTVYSISNIPYGSMQPAMTKDSNERTQLASFRQAGSNLALLIATVGFMPIVTRFKNLKTGYLVAVGIFCICGILLQVYCYANTKERYVVEKPKEAKASLKDSYKALFKNSPLLTLCIANLLTFSAYNVKLAVQVYYCQYVLKSIAIVSYMGLFGMSCVFIGVAMVPFVSKKIGKKYTYMLGCAIWAGSDILAFFLAKNAVVFIIFTAFAYLGNAFVNSLNWALVSDAVEYGEWKTGVRSEGVVYSFFTFFRKLSQAIAGFVPGIVLAWIGYVPNAVQKASTLVGIKGLMFIYSGALVGLTIVVIGIFYKLSEEKYNQIMKDLKARKTLPSA